MKAVAVSMQPCLTQAGRCSPCPMSLVLSTAALAVNQSTLPAVSYQMLL